MATLSEAGTDPVADRPGEVPELDLLLHWPERHSRRGWLGIAAVSVAVNLLFITVVVQAPVTPLPAPPERRVVMVKTRLYMPKDLLTQKAPNTRTPSKNIDLNDLLAVQGSRANRARPVPSRRRFEVPTASPVAKAPKTAPQITAEAPNVTSGQPTGNLPAGTPNGLMASAPPPPAPPDQPFQNVGSEPVTNHPKIAVPKATVQSALQSLTKPSDGGLTVSDDNKSRPSPPVPGLNAQNATQHAAIELQSDPQGADFRAYLAQVLTIVRTNWRGVIPQSVHMGTLRGRTVVEFIISRDGSIPKLVTADSSGSEALDRAAVAGLSMSNPLPPLPADFKGAQVRLAFTFSYNMPSAQ
jgi:TonB family protein